MTRARASGRRRLAAWAALAVSAGVVALVARRAPDDAPAADAPGDGAADPTRDGQRGALAPAGGVAAAPAPGPRRIVVRLRGSLASPTTEVGFARDADDGFALDRGRFVRTADDTFVCDDPRLGLATAAPPEVVVARGGAPRLRLPVPVPRTDAGGWAAVFDVEVVAHGDDVASFAGRVVTSDGVPVPDVTVEVRRAGSAWPPATLGAPARTGEDGGFRLALAVGPDLPHAARLVACAQPWHVLAAADVVLERGVARTVPDLVVEVGARVRGVLATDDASPTIRFLDAGPVDPVPRPEAFERWLQSVPRTTVAADGAFEVTGLPAALTVLVARLEVGPWVNVHPDVEATCWALVEAPATGVTLATRCRQLTLVAEDEAGRVEPFDVTLDGHVGALHLRSVPGSDLDVVVPVAAPLRVTVRAAGHATLATTLDAGAAGDPVRLRLERDASVPAPEPPFGSIDRAPGPTLVVRASDDDAAAHLRARLTRAGPTGPLDDVVTLTGTPRGWAAWRGLVRSPAVLVPPPGARRVALTATCAPFVPTTVEVEVPDAAATEDPEPVVVRLGRR